MAEVQWIGIGKVLFIYEKEWLLYFRILFFRKKISLSSIKASPEKKKKKIRRKKKNIVSVKKAAQMIRAVRIDEWLIGIDTGDYISNAWLYPVNFLPYSHGHIYVNFTDENYFFMKAHCRAWKMIYSYWR